MKTLHLSPLHERESDRKHVKHYFFSR